MIQRIQSIYLLLVSMISIAGLWITTKTHLLNRENLIFDQHIVISALFLVLIILATITIFLFKKRKLQFVLGRLQIILNFILLGVFVYGLTSLSGEHQVSKKDIEVFFPLISIVLIVLANKAIKRDEDLVKSVDRLR